MISVAVDGPAGAGKSTICRRAAERLSFVYVDTGALYRAVGLYVLEQGADPANRERVESLLRGLSVDLRFGQGGQTVLVNGLDVSEQIRTPAVSMAASAVSAIPAVRQFLFDTQRRLAEEHNVVMDGRDIGTVVLPDATVKIFLTAPLATRAKRRLLELEQKGQAADLDTVLREMEQRDYNDSHRAAAPLRRAEDAILLDNGELTLEQSVDEMIRLVEETLRRLEQSESGEGSAQ